MKLYVIILLMVFSTFSCASNKRTVIKHSIKLEGKNTNIRDLMNIDGYYTGYTDNKRLHLGLGGFTFFEDGTFVNNGHLKEGATIDSIQKNMTEWIYSWVDNKGRFRWGNVWGTYRIENDTIIAQAIFPSYALLRGWESTEYRFKVINRTTINHFYYSLSPEKANSGKKVDYTYMFVPCDSLPTADMPLKEYKWIWRNEQGWKDYMERIKEKKKK